MLGRVFVWGITIMDKPIKVKVGDTVKFQPANSKEKIGVVVELRNSDRVKIQMKPATPVSAWIIPRSLIKEIIRHG